MYKILNKLAYPTLLNKRLFEANLTQYVNKQIRMTNTKELIIETKAVEITETIKEVDVVRLPNTKSEVQKLLDEYEKLGNAIIERPINREMPKEYKLKSPTLPTDLQPQEKILKLCTYNVASVNAALKKGLKEYTLAEDADIVCLQETKLNEVPKDLFLEYPYQYWNHSKIKKGYSGTAVLSKIKPISHEYDILGDKEGRVISMEFEDFYLVNAYVPNAGEKLKNLDKRLQFDKVMKLHLDQYEKKKSIIYTGDLNVAHHVIDLAKPKENLRSAGFSIEERESFTTQLNSEYSRIDIDRYFHPQEGNRYTYYGYRSGTREKQNGWRLDYFIVSKKYLNNIIASDIRFECYGASDHLPSVMWFKTKVIDVNGNNIKKRKQSKVEDFF